MRLPSTSGRAAIQSTAAIHAFTDSGAHGNGFSPVPGASMTSAARPSAMHMSLAQPRSSLKTSAPHMMSTAPTGFDALGARKWARIDLPSQGMSTTCTGGSRWAFALRKARAQSALTSRFKGDSSHGKRAMA